MMLRMIYAVIYMLLSATALADAPKHQSSTSMFPKLILDFEQISFKDYRPDDPGLGVSYGYNSPLGITATIYSFNMGLEEISSSDNNPELIKLRNQTTNEIMELAARNGISLNHALNTVTSVTTRRGGKKQVFVDAFTARNSLGQIDSFLWLWTAQNHFFKIRITVPPEGNLDRKAILNFANEIIKITSD